ACPRRKPADVGRVGHPTRAGGNGQTQRDKLEAACGRQRTPRGKGAAEQPQTGNTEGSDLLEPCAVKVARTVLRGGGGGNAAPLPGALLLGTCPPPCYTRVRNAFHSRSVTPTAEARPG